MKKQIYLIFVFSLAAHVVFSQTVEEYLNTGERYFLMGRFHEARSAVEEAVHLDPKNALLHFYLGSIYYELNENILALKYFSNTIELDNTFASAYFWRAGIYEKILQDHANALDNYDMAVYLEPENDRYRRDRGNFLYTVIGDFISARIDFHRAVEIDPLNYLNFQYRGVFYAMYGLHEAALEDYNAAIKLNSEETSNFSNKGTTLLFLGREKEAMENFNIALRLDNTNFRAYFDRGHAHFRLGMYNEAVLDFTEVIRINPNPIDYRNAYFNRAHLYRLLADQSDNPTQAGYYLDKAKLDESVVSRLDSQQR